MGGAEQVCERTGLENVIAEELVPANRGASQDLLCDLNSRLPSLGLIPTLVQDVLEIHSLRAHIVSKPAPLWAQTQENC